MTLNNVWNIISMSTRWAETISLPPHPALPLPPWWKLHFMQYNALLTITWSRRWCRSNTL